MISAIFFWREIVEICWIQSEQVKNGPFERGLDGFSYFLLIFLKKKKKLPNCIGEKYNLTALFNKKLRYIL